MFRLLAVTLAGIYGVLYVFGDEARRPADVSRAEPLGLQLVAAASLPFEAEQGRLHVSDISDQEAVQLAMAAGERVRTERVSFVDEPVLLVASPELAASVTAAEPEPEYWYVTGSLVNLRDGPGTSNPVVGQVQLGDEAEVLSDVNGWYEIRLTNGSGSGWIFGKFLDEQRPG